MTNDTTELDHWLSTQTTYIHQGKKKAVAGVKRDFLFFLTLWATHQWIYINSEGRRICCKSTQFIYLQGNVTESLSDML